MPSGGPPFQQRLSGRSNAVHIAADLAAAIADRFVMLP